MDSQEYWDLLVVRNKKTLNAKRIAIDVLVLQDLVQRAYRAGVNEGQKRATLAGPKSSLFEMVFGKR